MNNDIHFGILIRELLEKKEGSMKAAAEKLEYNLESLYPIFKKRDVSTRLLKTICEKYDIDLTYFLGRSNNTIQLLKSLNDGNIELLVSEKLDLDKRVAVLESENNSLMEQMKLYREMVTMYKEQMK